MSHSGSGKQGHVVKRSEFASYMFAICGLTGVLLNLAILISTSPQGYSVNIYSQMPSQYWIILFATYLLGTTLILSTTRDSFKKIGVGILGLNYIIFLLFPHILGYYVLSRADDISYLAHIIFIVKTGHINIEDIYPAVHIFYAQVSLMTGIEPSTLAMLLPAFFSIVFACGILVFSKVFIKEKCFIYILVPVTLIFYLRYMHFSLAPHYCFYTLMPVFLYILYHYLTGAKNNYQWNILAIIFILIIPMGHPFISIFVIFVLASLLLIKRFLKMDIRYAGDLLVMLVVMTLAWFINCFYLLKSFKALYTSFIQHAISPVAKQGTNLIAKVSLLVTPKDILVTAIFLFARYIIAFVIIFAAFIMVFRDKQGKLSFKKEYKYLLACFVVLGIADAFFIFNPFLSHTIARITTLNYFVYPMIPLLALSLYLLFLKKQSMIYSVLVSVILACVFSLSVYGALPSPKIFDSNSSVVYNEVAGMRWLFDKKGGNPMMAVLDPQAGPRFCDLFYGWTEKRTREDVGDYIVPDHFGYEGSDQFRIKDRYVLIMGWAEHLYTDVLVYTNVNKDILTRFKTDDFSRFKDDSNVDKVYNSLNIEVYKS
jgi:hypothetical protein